MNLKHGQKGTRSATASCGLPFGPGVVTAECFDEKALSFMRASGRDNGSHPVIRDHGDDDVAWESWMAYLRRLGRKSVCAERSGVMTVPAKYPWDFSADADDLRDAGDELLAHRRHPRNATLSPERRAELSALGLGHLLRSVKEASYKPPRRNNRLPSSFDEAREAPPLTLSTDALALATRAARPFRTAAE